MLKFAFVVIAVAFFCGALAQDGPGGPHDPIAKYIYDHSFVYHGERDRSLHFFLGIKNVKEEGRSIWDDEAKAYTVVQCKEFAYGIRSVDVGKSSMNSPYFLRLGGTYTPGDDDYYGVELPPISVSSGIYWNNQFGGNVTIDYDNDNEKGVYGCVMNFDVVYGTFKEEGKTYLKVPPKVAPYVRFETKFRLLGDTCGAQECQVLNKAFSSKDVYALTGNLYLIE